LSADRFDSLVTIPAHGYTFEARLVERIADTIGNIGRRGGRPRASGRNYGRKQYEHGAEQDGRFYDFPLIGSRVNPESEQFESVEQL